MKKSGSMLKRIKRHQVRVGMFITDIEDPLRDEAAPVRSFMLKDEAAAAKVKASNIISLVIDIRRGVDVGSGRAQPDMRQSEASLSNLSRPFTQTEIKEALQTIEQTRPLLDTLFSNARMNGKATFEPADRAVEQIAKSMESNPAALIGITRLKTKDEYTFLHSIAVSALMVHFARFLKFDEQTVRILGASGLLHDIGKMVMPDALLSKKSALTDEEMARSAPIRCVATNCCRARATCRRPFWMSACTITSGSTARVIPSVCRTSRSALRPGSRPFAMSMMR